MKTKLLIFGITGDLSARKLLPALKQIYASGDYDDMEIIGASRRQVNVEELVSQSLGDAELASRIRVVTMDMAHADDYFRLKDELALQDDEQLLAYLSVPPAAATQIVDFMGEAGLNTPNVKILFEKPFGMDLASAHDAVERTARYFDESQLYRIDHYAAKEVAGQLIRLRRNADSHHHHWGNETVERIEIVATEAIGIEGRAQFYEQTGALRDFVQGHLLQLLALVLMDPTKDDTPDARLGALALLRPADPAITKRAQYEGYQEEAENPGSLVETFVSVQLESNDPQWQGVPLVLTTGKALDKKRSQIVVHYKDGTTEILNEEGAEPANGERKLDAYERVLLDAIHGEKTVFTTSDEVIRSWEILAPIQDAWDMSNRPLPTYSIGSTVEDILK